MEALRRFYAKVCAVEEVVAQACLIISAAIITWGALTRAAGHPANWSIEMACFFFGWAVFLAADVAMRNDRHVAVDILVQRLPVRVQLGLKLFNSALILMFLVCLVWYGVSITWVSRFRAFQGIPGFSYAWVTLSAPVGSLLLAITTIGKMVDMVRQWRKTAGQFASTPGAAAGSKPCGVEERA